MNGIEQCEEKMRRAGVSEAAIRAFARCHAALERGETGMIGEETIQPVPELPRWQDCAAETGDFDPALLRRAVVIKLNGGLGTSMGLQKVKSVLPLRGEATFLDLIVRQIDWLRRRHGARVRLLLMNSFATSDDTLQWLGRYRDWGMAERSEVELLQNQVPKLDAATLGPVAWPADPELEWCPPGHGDLYPALTGSGWLDRLLEDGVKYAFVSNSDNLGAVLEPGLLQRFAESGAPFLMEVTRRTAADRKGGHLAVRRGDRRLLLREVAQCPEPDLEAFQDIGRHRYFNTNSLWLRLDALREVMAENGGLLPLPMISNRKTVDPRDKASTRVIQLETAMGAAIECFEGARAIDVPRTRFAPVKTSADLLALRSDAYRVSDDGRIMLAPERDGEPPVVVLDERYRLVDALDRLGVPSLVACRKLVVEGPVRLQDGVRVEGEVTFRNPGLEEWWVPPGTYRDHVVVP
jgi:UDP-N-acetylglucosamine pyrophosphorylase